MDELALQFGVTKSVLVILISVFAALVLGTAVRLTMLRHSDPEKRKTRIGSLIAWWVMAAIMAIAVLLGQYAGILLFAVLSVMGLREFLRITGQRLIVRIRDVSVTGYTGSGRPGSCWG